jgi:hypothetical protein
MDKDLSYKCVVSGKPIPEERVEALKMLGIPEARWTCVEHSLTKPRQGVYLGEVGTSELLFVDKVYDDSVRSVFKAESKSTSKLEDEDNEDYDDDEISVEQPYNAKELSYYNSPDEQVEAEEQAKSLKRGDL